MKAPLAPNEAKRLEALRNYAVLDTPAELAFDDLARLAALFCQTPIALVVLVDETRQWFKAKVGVEVAGTARDIAFCAHTILNNREVMEVRDAMLDPRFSDNPLVTSNPHIRFYAGVPLVMQEGYALGTLCVIDRKPKALSAEQLSALSALGRQAIAILEWRRHAGELATQVAENQRIGALMQQHFDELSASKQETDRLWALGERSRRALLSVLEDEKQAGKNLRASEELKHSVLNSMLAHIAVLDRDGEIVAINDAWEQFTHENNVSAAFTQRGLESKLPKNSPTLLQRTGVGANYLEGCRESRGENSSEAMQAHDGLKRVLRGEQNSFSLEYPCDSESNKRWFLMTATALKTKDGGAVVAHLDISAHKRAEALLKVDNQILQMIASGAQLPEVLAAIAKSVESAAHNALCSVLLLDEDGIHLRHGAGPSLPEDYNQAVDGAAIGANVGSCGTAAYLKKTVIVADIARDSRWANYRELALQHGLKACWSTPIKDASERVLGTFAVYYREPRSPHPFDFKLIESATNQAKIVIERKRAETALRRSNLLLEASQATAKLGGWELDLGTHELFWTAETYRLHDTTQEEFNPTVDAGVGYFLPESRRIISAALQAAIERGEGYDLELETLTTKGRRIDVRTTCAVTLHAGRPAKLTGIFQDITERKRAEAALRESEARWQFALEGAGDGVWDWDVPTNIVFYSKQFKEILGYTEAEIGSALEEWSSRVHPEDMPRVMAILQPHLDGMATNYIIEHRMRCKDGSYKWILDRGLVITRDAAGKPQRMVGTHSDITQRKQMEEQLRQTASSLEQRVIERTQALQAAQLSKTRFFAAASHDLLQPLNAARIFAASLAEQRNLSDAARHIAQRIDSALLGAEEVIDVLVDVAKLDTGAVRAVIEDLDLHELLTGLTDQFGSIAERRNLQLRVGPCKVIVRSDRRLLRRILQNLIANALRYTASGGVLIGARRLPGAQIRVDVVDTGPGIAEEAISEIFEEFRRGGHSSPWGEKGLGLGLAICVRICELLGHKLSVSSMPGRGSTFSLSLGNFRVSTDIASLAMPMAPTQFSLTQLRVLCVDDNIEVLDAMITLLRGWDVPCVQANDHSSALEAARISRPDVVIVDYQFDDAHSGDGLQIIAALRNLYPTQPPMAIMVTANRTVELKEITKNLGIALLQKPLRAARLRSLLESASRSYDSASL